jgi:epoxyqueuosine reductase QueG
MDSSDVKNLAAELGADLCGIAPLDRFVNAPKGYHPTDVLPGCRSVIVVALRFPVSTLEARSTIPYTVVRNDLSAAIDRLTVRLSLKLESCGVTAVPVGAIGPDEFDAETGKFRGIISLKHAAELAGLGKIGRNTLLINDRYGNMIWLGAVITTAALVPDPLSGYEACVEGCSLCLDSCPVNALDGVSMDQRRCHEYAFGPLNGGEWRIKCYTCRKICPHCKGI